MMNRRVPFPSLLVSLLAPVLFCATLAGASSPSPTSGLHFGTSPVNILGSKVLVRASPNLRYLSAPEAKALLIKEGNPPDAVSDIEGLLVPTSANGQDSWFVVLTENTDGHVSDADAAKINYDDLLSQMKSDTQDNNKARTEAGYDAVTLMGWAEAPTYDPAQHSMVWAKDMVFGDPEKGAAGSHHTLNYAVRVLGRQDVLELNAVGSYDQLAQIKAGMQTVLPAVQFTAGNRYQDFNEGSDKLATYGLAGLIAGGVVAQKVGLFGVLLLFLKKGWILIVGGLALVRRLAGGVANARANRTERAAGQQAQAAPVSTTPSPATFAVHPDLLPRMSLSKQEDGQGADDKPLGRHGG